MALFKNKFINRWASAILILLLLLVSCLLAWYGLNEGHYWGGDFSAYIMQARSICQRKIPEFLQANQFTVEESMSQLGPVAYPWGFPVILAPLYAVFGLNMLALKSLNILFYVIFLISLWLGFRQYHSYFWRIILFCLFAFNPYIFLLMNNVLSDIPFLAISTITILLIGEVIIQRRTFISDIGDQLLLGVLIAISFFIRSQGILILAVLGITQLIEILKNVTLQQRRDVGSIEKVGESLLRDFFIRSSNLWIFLLPHVSFLIVSLLWRSVLPEGGLSYIFFLKDLSLWTIKKNIYHYFIIIPPHFLNWVPASQIIYGASILLAIIGLYERRKTDYHIILYSVIYMLILIIYPYRNGLRLLFPLLPFYVSFVITGLVKFRDNYQGIWNILWRIFGLSSVIVILIFFLRFSTINASENIANQRRVTQGPFISTAIELFSFISKNIEPDKIIVFYKPRVMRLFTNRNSIAIYQVDKLRKGDYLCISLKDAYDQIEDNDLKSLQEDGKIILIYENKDFLLYKINKLQL